MKKALLIILTTILCIFLIVGIAYSQNNITIFVNGQKIETDVPPQIINGRTMVPVRFVSEALGADVEWDGMNRRVLITNEKSEIIKCKEYIEKTYKFIKKIEEINANMEDYIKKEDISDIAIYERLKKDNELIKEQIDNFILLNPPQILSKLHQYQTEEFYSIYNRWHLITEAFNAKSKGNLNEATNLIKASLIISNRIKIIVNNIEEETKKLKNIFNQPQ